MRARCSQAFRFLSIFIFLLVCKSRHNASAWGENLMKPALSIAFSVADAQEVQSEHESIDPVTDTVTVGGARCSVVDGFALLRSLFLEAGQTTANACRYAMTGGSRSVDLPHLAFLGAWVLPGETEVNRNILCGKVGLDDRSQCSIFAEQIKIFLALAGMAGANLSTKTNLVLIRGVMRKEFWNTLNWRQTHVN